MQSAACLSELRREEAGPFRVADADPWNAVREGRIVPRPIREALGGMPIQVVDADDAQRIAHGMAVAAAVPEDRVALLSADGELLAVARRENDRWQPEVVLAVA
jgi:tRNA U55 pseudouridine synthase TruB